MRGLKLTGIVLALLAGFALAQPITPPPPGGPYPLMVQQAEAVKIAEHFGITGGDNSVGLTYARQMLPFFESEHAKAMSELKRLSELNERAPEFNNPQTGVFDGGPANPNNPNNAYRRKQAITRAQAHAENTIFRLNRTVSAIDRMEG